jgi:hypothetical protein
MRMRSQGMVLGDVRRAIEAKHKGIPMPIPYPKT